MSDTYDDSSVPKSFLIVGVVALLWNAIGIATYIMSVTMSPEALQIMPEAERVLYDVPWWYTSAYAIGVFGGTLACVGLLIRKAWSVNLFVLSLVAVVVQMGYALLGTDLLAVKGGSAAVMPILIVVVAGFLAWYASSARNKKWLS